MNKILSSNLSKGDGPRISARCPGCGQNGTFDSLPSDDLIDQAQNIWYGQRRCPNQKCGIHIFYIKDSSNESLYVYPQETIDFDRAGIPLNVLSALEEAIKCHSIDCFVASAIMIRKTLEEICSDRNVKADNLKTKLKKLGEKIFIPKELIEGMNELRLLGNDAAHIEASTFNDIGKLEIEISIEFTKEILKGVYQYEGLLGKLRSLKKESL